MAPASFLLLERRETDANCQIICRHGRSQNDHIHCVAEDGRSGPVRFIGVIPNTAEALTKIAKQLARHGELDFCYEAGGQSALVGTIFTTEDCPTRNLSSPRSRMKLSLNFLQQIRYGEIKAAGQLFQHPEPSFSLPVLQL